MDDIVFIGDWIKDRVLGTGSFGVVVLWKHKRTEEKLAIKTCKWGDELTAKHRERWTKEVEMLQSCRHPNIVGTKELPSEFIKGLERANPSKLPILCMEYCSGGDLRQLLNKPESCAGLKEPQVRQILSDMCNAIQFLHQNRITHRDLKPENIVMHILDINVAELGTSSNQRKVIYKLVDLGYAKEIDSNSVCASFVGTLQYLAPEILYSKTYSNSVDYWSFGLLAFEIICGVRPFLPFMTPVQWMPHVKKKGHENICVYETFHGDIECSSKIFAENYVSQTFKALIEDWLPAALEWDPKLRGRDTPSKVTFNIPSEEKEAASNVIIFTKLNEILASKIIKIFSVSTLSQRAYKIDHETNIYTLKTWLFNDTKIPISDQIILSPSSCVDIGNDELVIKYHNENSNIMLFLYDKVQIIKDDVEPLVPKVVQRCLEHPKQTYNFKNSQNLYRCALFFVMSQMELYDSLIRGICSRGEMLKQESKQLLLKHNAVDKDIGKLLVQDETINKMTEVGKRHIQNIRDSGNGTNYLGGFEKIFSDVDELSEKIYKLQSAWSQLSVRLQSAVRRSNEPLVGELNNFVTKYNYQNVFTNAIKAYMTYKKNEFSAERGKDRQCLDITKVCYDCLKLRSKMLAELQNQPFILKIKDLNTELTKIAEIISNASENTDKLTRDLSKMADELTTCIWTTLGILASDAENLTDIPYSVVSYQKRNFKLGEPVSDHCIKVNNVDSNGELKSLIEESLLLRKNQANISEKLNMQKELMKKTVQDFSLMNSQ